MLIQTRLLTAPRKSPHAALHHPRRLLPVAVVHHEPLHRRRTVPLLQVHQRVMRSSSRRRVALVDRERAVRLERAGLQTRHRRAAVLQEPYAQLS